MKEKKPQHLAVFFNFRIIIMDSTQVVSSQKLLILVKKSYFLKSIEPCIQSSENSKSSFGHSKQEWLEISIDRIIIRKEEKPCCLSNGCQRNVSWYERQLLSLSLSPHYFFFSLSLSYNTPTLNTLFNQKFFISLKNRMEFSRPKQTFGLSEFYFGKSCLWDTCLIQVRTSLGSNVRICGGVG